MKISINQLEEEVTEMKVKNKQLQDKNNQLYRHIRRHQKLPSAIKKLRIQKVSTFMIILVRKKVAK